MKEALVFLGVFFIVLGVAKTIWAFIRRRSQREEGGNG